MSNDTIHTQAPYEAVLEALTGLPQEMTGDGKVMEEALERSGLVLLGLIRDAFIIKSMGGTDDAGDRWAPLQPSTVEDRARKRKGRPSSVSKRRKGETSKVYDASMRRFKSIMKSQGKAPTYNKYGGRDTAILHDSGKLLESLTPGSNSPDQVLEVSAGSFTIGTKREGAAAHHNGTGKLPQRRLWPYPNDFPQHWWDMICKGIQDGAVETIKDIIRGAM